MRHILEVSQCIFCNIVSQNPNVTLTFCLKNQNSRRSVQFPRSGHRLTSGMSHFGGVAGPLCGLMILPRLPLKTALGDTAPARAESAPD